MMTRFAARLPCLLLCAVFVIPVAAEETHEFDGRKKCSSCHKSEYRSWKKTAHARALEDLKPGNKAEAKQAAGLKPDKDYSENEKCVPCHVTGYGEDRGYEIEDPSKYLIGVGCESCHGPGEDYRRLHRKAGDRFERKQQTTPREALVEAGQEFEFKQRCYSCHMNYEGSPWAGAKKPYTPFTPEVDPKYAFDFDHAIRDNKAMHEHYKLDGTFTGPPLPPFHEEFQDKAKTGDGG